MFPRAEEDVAESLLRVSSRLYRLAMLLYPGEFRRAYAEEMTAAYDAMLRHTYAARGARAVASMQFTAAWDVLRIAAREHRLRRRASIGCAGATPPLLLHHLNLRSLREAIQWIPSFKISATPSGRSDPLLGSRRLPC